MTERKVVVVTGSAGGVGAAIAVHAAAQGHAVVVNSRTPARLDPVMTEILDGGGSVIGVAEDLRDQDAAFRVADAAVEAFGRVDVWINNAAGVFLARAETISPNGWRSIIEANFMTTVCGCLAALRVMRAERHGSIINIASGAADRPHPRGAHYAAAKAAVISLTKTLAWEWAEYGIQVNAVALGPVLTTESRYNDGAERDRIERYIPRGQIANPEEVAEAIWSLAQISTTYFSGAVINLDGVFRSVVPPSKNQL